MYGIVTFNPKARSASYDGTNIPFIKQAAAEMFNGTVNDTMAVPDGSLLIVLPGGATHVLLPGYSMVEFLGELRIVETTKLRYI